MCTKCENLFYTCTIHPFGQLCTYCMVSYNCCIAEKLYQKFVVNILYSTHFTVQSQKISDFPVLMWQTLPIDCYIWEINRNIQDFFLHCQSLKLEWLTVPNNIEYSEIFINERQWTLHVSCKRNRSRPINFPSIQWFSQDNVCIYTQISLNTLNIWNFLRDTAKISKLHMLGIRLLSHSNKYGCE